MELLLDSPSLSPSPPAGQAPAGDADTCERPLFDVFAEIAARQPDHLAVDDGAARLTYAELHDRALALGARIAAQVPAGGLAGVLVPTSVLTVVAWLGCLAARRPFLPLDTQLPPARNLAIVAEACLAAAIIPSASVEFAAWLPTKLARIPMAGDLGPRPPRLPHGLPPSEIGMVLFTSGSSGRPKGIALHERSQLRKALNYRAACGLGPHDRLLSLHPPSTNGGAGDVLGALLCGASLHLAELKRDGLAPALASLRHGGITVCATVPAVVRTLVAMDHAADAFRGLRVLRLGGDTVMASDISALAPLLAPAARILVRFGMTESGATIAQRVIDPHDPGESGPLALETGVPGQTIDVVDTKGNPVLPGAPGEPRTGELLIRGRYVALGHWVAGKLDATAFPADPAMPGARIVRSGDVVLLRPDGMLVPIGRADRQVKINGIRVEPAETEAALRTLPNVADAAVIVHGDPNAPVLLAFVVPKARETPAQLSGRGADALMRGWRSALAGLLPPQQVPARIRVVPRVPLLPSMKPDIAALRALAAEDPPGMFARIWTLLRGARSREFAPLA